VCQLQSTKESCQTSIKNEINGSHCTCWRSTSSANFVWMRKISRRSVESGIPISTSQPNRPNRRSAGSICSRHNDYIRTSLHVIHESQQLRDDTTFDFSVGLTSLLAFNRTRSHISTHLFALRCLFRIIQCITARSRGKATRNSRLASEVMRCLKLLSIPAVWTDTQSVLPGASSIVRPNE
jgi:hypothetical protein